MSPKTIRDIWNHATWAKATRHLWAEAEQRLTADAEPAKFDSILASAAVASAAGGGEQGPSRADAISIRSLSEAT